MVIYVNIIIYINRRRITSDKFSLNSNRPSIFISIIVFYDDRDNVVAIVKMHFVRKYIHPIVIFCIDNFIFGLEKIT